MSYENDRLLLVIKLAGMPFESINDDMLINRFDARNRLFASAAKEKGARLAIWTTLNRRQSSFSTEYRFPSNFAKTFADKYLQRFTHGRHYENTFYISLVLKLNDGMEEGIAELEELGQNFVNAFGAYDAEILEAYEYNGQAFSQVYEFVGELINGQWQKMPVLTIPANEIVTMSTLHFGYDILEMRGDDFTKFATCYDLKDFPPTTTWGQFDSLLTSDAEFTLTQSWLCMPPFAAQRTIKKQINKLLSADDQAMHQIDELESAVGYISSGGGAAKTTDDESAKIKLAVDTVFAIEDKEQRCFSRLLDSIPRSRKDNKNGLRERLAKWCRSENGEYQWALDNAKNEFQDVTQHRMLGFDVSNFLKTGYEPTEPILAYLLHLKSLMQEEGELMASVVEEFWLPAQYPTTRDMIFDALKTGRKKGEFMLLVSQSPEDAINSSIFDALITQTATKIFLPNPSANYESYKKCNLTEKEFSELKGLAENSRTFLIKQGNQSVFAMLDLYGMDDEIAVLSSDVENIKKMDKVIRDFGSDPDIWLPIFQSCRKGKKAIKIEVKEEETE